MNSTTRRHGPASALARAGLAALLVALGLGCGDSEPTGPRGALAVEDIDRMKIFVRNWPNDSFSEYVQVDFERIGGRSMLVLYRPAQPAAGSLPAEPRVLLDSIGPQDDPPPEIVEIVRTFDVWAMTDS